MGEVYQVDMKERYGLVEESLRSVVGSGILVVDSFLVVVNESCQHYCAKPLHLQVLYHR